MGLHACYGDSFTFVYIDYFRSSQETHLWVCSACYVDSFTFVYVDHDRTSQEAHIWTAQPATGVSSILT
jgi:hypothetical protein